jgi:hypothetical protein
MIDLAPFEPADLVEMELQAQQVAEMAGLGDWMPAASALAAAGPCWTVRYGGRVIAAGGVRVIWQGRGEAWAFVGDVPRRVWPALHRLVRRALDRLAADLGLRRIEAACAYGWPPGRRWLSLLGFQEEGLALAYGPDGRDFWRCARIVA